MAGESSSVFLLSMISNEGINRPEDDRNLLFASEKGLGVVTGWLGAVRPPGRMENA